MSNKILTIDLSGIPQTLLLPLVGRAKFSCGENSPIHDEEAIQLLKTLNYDFEGLIKRIGMDSAIWWIARAYHFDEAIKRYLKDHPTATIINLGAGLDTTFNRVDNGKLTWVDIDLPEVIEIRNKLFQTTDRQYSISKSVLDYSWMEDIKRSGNEVFFIAGGLFCYFEEDQVKSLFIEMANRFKGGELIFDSIAKVGVKYANKMLNQAKMSDAVIKWGFDYGNELQAWSPKIKLVSQIPYFKNIKTKYRYPLLTRLKMMFYDLNRKGGIIHLRFR